MSSHHFVKEGQEPPLIVLDWSERLMELAQQLLEWQPKFVVAAHVLDHVVMDGFKPDAVLDFEGELPAFLQPLESLETNSFFETLEAASFLLISDDWVKIVSYISNDNAIVYTEKYKVFKISKPYKKVLPKESKLFVLDEKTQTLQEVLLGNSQQYSLDDFAPKIIVEEL